mmetsp:Transcript_8434/g.17070  ORF Transcript_8434/g.17070 Transcript_8434/m.17070 type:complete len:93 (-) Transcript_8434:79-357(-)
MLSASIAHTGGHRARSSTLGAPALVAPSTTSPAEARACTTQHRHVVQHGLDNLRQSFQMALSGVQQHHIGTRASTVGLAPTISMMADGTVLS